MSPGPSAHLAQSWGYLKSRMNGWGRGKGGDNIPKQELEHLSVYQDERRKRWAWIQEVQGAPIWCLCFFLRYEELSSVDSEWGQEDQEFWESRKLYNGYLENMKQLMEKYLAAFKISFTSGSLPSFPLLFPSHHCLKILTCLHLKHMKPFHDPKPLSNHCLLSPPLSRTNS